MRPYALLLARTLALLAIPVASLTVLSPAAPTAARTLAGPMVTLSQANWMAPRVRASWDHYDVDVAYDVRLTRADSRAARRPAWRRPAALQGITQHGLWLAVHSGATVCVSVRTHLDTGETTPWSERNCRARAFDHTRLRTQGPVRRVTDTRMWGDHALVARGGRVFLPRVRTGATVGFIVTQPNAYSGFTLTVCRAVHAGDIAYAGDGLIRNEAGGLPGTQTRRCRVTYTRHAYTPRSFPLQGIWIFPGWA